MRIRITGDGNACAAIRDYLMLFADSADVQPDVTIAVGPSSRLPAADAEPLAINYRRPDEPKMFATMNRESASLDISDAGIDKKWLRHHVRFLMHRALLRRGAALLKGCSLDYQGRGVLICGPSGSGKTSAALLPLIDERFRFLADDISLVKEDGQLLTFPKPIWLHLYHAEGLPSAARKQLPVQFGSAKFVQSVGRHSLLKHPARMALRILRLWQTTRSWTTQLSKTAAHIGANAMFSHGQRVNATQVSVVIFLRPKNTNFSKTITVDDALNRLFGLMHYHSAIELLGEYAYAGLFDLKGFLDTTEEIWRKFLCQASDIIELSVADGSSKELQKSVARVMNDFSSRRLVADNRPVTTNKEVLQHDRLVRRTGDEIYKLPS